MTEAERAALVRLIRTYRNMGKATASAILAAIEPAIRASALEEAARLVETHRVAHVNHPPFHVVHANSGAMPEPDASQKALADAIRARKDKS